MPQAAAVAMVALAGFTAYNQIAKGKQQNEDAKYNATIKEGQAKMIGLESEIEQGQYDRQRAKYMSSATAQVAGSGLMLSGSSAAVILDTQTQIQIDQSIARFNKVQEKNYVMQEAGAFRREGKSARTAGYTNAFTTMLSAGANYGIPRTTAGTQRDITFDSISPMPGTAQSRANTFGLRYSGR
jgi:hypothetical protein